MIKIGTKVRCKSLWSGKEYDGYYRGKFRYDKTLHRVELFVRGKADNSRMEVLARIDNIQIEGE